MIMSAGSAHLDMQRQPSMPAPGGLRVIPTYLCTCLFVTLFGVTCYTLYTLVLRLVTLGDLVTWPLLLVRGLVPLGGSTRINRTQRVLNLGIITSTRIIIHMRACSRSHHTRSRGRRRERWGRARASRSERTSAQVHPFDVLAPCWHSPPCRRSSHLHASTREG